MAAVASSEQVRPTSRADWRAWLQAHHATSSGVWLLFAKKHAQLPTVSYNDAVEEALCFGWIDGLTRPVDDTFYMQRFTPRKANSRWAASNKQRVATMLAAGLMTPAGLQAVERAKRTGTWNAFDAVEAMEVPPDLTKALRAAKGAAKTFDAYTPGMKKQCLYYVNDAKRPETRAKRIGIIVAAAAAGTKPFQS